MGKGLKESRSFLVSPQKLKLKLKALELKKMELVSEKEKKNQSDNNNSSDNTNNAHSVVDSASDNLNSTESQEFRERQARDLKAGLHPLRVKP